MLERWPDIHANSIAHWRRPLRGWELDEFRMLDEVIRRTSVSQDEDKIRWNMTGEN